MEEIIHNYIQSLDAKSIVGVEIFIYTMGMLFVISGVYLLVKDHMEWYAVLRSPKTAKFPVVWTYAFVYMPMYLFFFSGESTIVTFVVTLVIFSLLHALLVWIRVGQFSTGIWSYKQAVLEYLNAQVHVTLLVVGAICLRIVLLFVQSRGYLV